MRAQIFLIIITMTISTGSWAQKIEVDFQSTPLNHVLSELSNQYKFQISFSDEELSAFEISISKSFDDVESALNAIIEKLPFTVLNQSGVFIIIRKQAIETPKNYRVAGTITDAISSEPLPFTALLINETGIATDLKGNFNYISETDSIFKLKIRYLGYYILDTVVQSNTHHKFKLKPSSFELKEILIETSLIENTLQTGSHTGEMRLNNTLVKLLPGNGDNSVFNLLRLQPGIVAAGEQSNDIIVWGSYEGQSQVYFDGLKIYGLNNFYDNISSVNPFLVKDIQVLKGGYGVEQHSRIGGVVNITGIDGNVDKPTVRFNVNNLTLNGMLSAPIGKKTAISLAYRQTYYNLYDSLNLRFPVQLPRNNQARIDAVVIPEYKFSDFNLKYAGKINNDNFYISYYQGTDNFKYRLDTTDIPNLLSTYREDNSQRGIVAFYGKKWKNNNISNFTLSQSEIDTESVNRQRIFSIENPNNSILRENSLFSMLNETSIRNENMIAVNSRNQLEFGFNAELTKTAFTEDSLRFNTLNQATEMNVIGGYAKNNIALNENISFTYGLRSDYSQTLSSIHFQPRVSTSVKLNETSKINASWGLYNQFVSKSMMIDSLGNEYYHWVASDENVIPVLKSRHLVMGYYFNRNNFTLSVEAYDKFTNGLTFYFRERITDKRTLYSGDGRSRGVDIFLKKEHKGNMAWVSYSLSKTEERFPITIDRRGQWNSSFVINNYSPSLSDQRHELKLAGILSFNPFYISMNYVLGSGFPERKVLNPNNIIYENPYRRLDIAALYKFNTKRINLEMGLSILNVLNRANIKHSSFIFIPTPRQNSVNIYSESVPFTPTLFLNISF